MKGIIFALVLTLAAAISSCTSLERSRSLGDPRLTAKTIALQVCSNCHGIDDVSVSPNFPNLAAQQEVYLIEQMKSFKNHNRSDPAGFDYMWGLSTHLTDDQIKGLAAYYASTRPSQGTSADVARISKGQLIFEKGIPENNVPSCLACHGQNAEGNQQTPRLAGQHADYLVKQLKVFQRTDERPEGAIMKGIAHLLTIENMENVAAYLEAMPQK
jgi:cytochrome c553